MLQYPNDGANQAIRVPGGRFWRKSGMNDIRRKNMSGVAKQNWAIRLEEKWQGEIIRNFSLAQLCTLKIGGPAKVLAVPSCLTELQKLLRILHELNVPWLVLGGGSNILFSDRGFDGVIISLGRKFGNITKCEEGGCGPVKVHVEAGCSLMRLVNWCTEQGFTGLEFAAGIPGSVGGAISMNAGAWGQEMADVLSAVTFVTAAGVLEEKPRSELTFFYRCLEKGANVVAIGEFMLTPADRGLIAEKVREVQEKRKKTQPQGVASAGSFFKNPQGDAAGRLIEAAGLKGLCKGGAMVSSVHANFIINKGSATSADVLALMKLVQEEVKQRFGVVLEPEVAILGEQGSQHLKLGEA